MTARTQTIASKSVLRDFVSAESFTDLRHFATTMVGFIVRAPLEISGRVVPAWTTLRWITRL